MKKFLSLLLACVMGLTLLAGCNSNTDPSSSSTGQTDKNESHKSLLRKVQTFLWALPLRYSPMKLHII